MLSKYESKYNSKHPHCGNALGDRQVVNTKQ